MALRTAGLSMSTVLIAIAGGAASPPPAAAQASPPADDPGVKRGADAWAAGDYQRALGLWRPLAARGDANAQYNLGQAYRLGRGVAADPEPAREWYLKAARQGHPQAQANYGLMLFQAGERKEALPWLEKAADRGDARAQYVVGTALFNGDVAGRDWVRAYALMTRAAAAGLPQAVSSLAQMDRFVPLAQRTQGTALARDLERGALLEEAGAPPGMLVGASGAEIAAVAAPVVPAPGVAARPATATPPAPPAGGRRASQPRPSAPIDTSRAVTSPGARETLIEARPAQAVAKLAVAPRAVGGRWRVQVGAFSSPAAAASAWQAVAARVPGLGLQPYQIAAGRMTRLQAGPLATRAAADAACARIRTAAGVACFALPAR